MEAQRYPEDFDGIVAGAPAANWSGRALQSLWVAQAVQRTTASYIPPAKYPRDPQGRAGGVRRAGRRRGWHPRRSDARASSIRRVLQCQGADAPSCLTAAQVETARKIYENHGAYPGLAPGSELGWATYGGAEAVRDRRRSLQVRRLRRPGVGLPHAGLQRRSRKRYRRSRHDERAQSRPEPFFARGGKLIQYHGWSDPQIPPMHSVDYYESVVEAMGEGGAIRTACSWFRGCSIAAAGRGRTSSTRWRRWSDGGRQGTAPGPDRRRARHE